MAGRRLWRYAKASDNWCTWEFGEEEIIHKQTKGNGDDPTSTSLSTDGFWAVYCKILHLILGTIRSGTRPHPSESPRKGRILGWDEADFQSSSRSTNAYKAHIRILVQWPPWHLTRTISVLSNCMSEGLDNLQRFNAIRMLLHLPSYISVWGASKTGYFSRLAKTFSATRCFW
jgi:hypothetical protein